MTTCKVLASPVAGIRIRNHAVARAVARSGAAKSVGSYLQVFEPSLNTVEAQWSIEQLAYAIARSGTAEQIKDYLAFFQSRLETSAGQLAVQNMAFHVALHCPRDVNDQKTRPSFQIFRPLSPSFLLPLIDVFSKVSTYLRSHREAQWTILFIVSAILQGDVRPHEALVRSILVEAQKLSSDPAVLNGIREVRYTLNDALRSGNSAVDASAKHVVNVLPLILMFLKTASQAPS